ncbi:MAG: DUF192 domain-containing protein [Gemmatimonadota bacterium]
MPHLPGFAPPGRIVGPALLLAVATLAAAGCGPAAGGDGAGGGEPAGSPPAVQESVAARPQPGPGGRILRTVEVRVGGVPVTVEIADTPALRERGLMHRDSLPANHGMLFVYPDEEVRSFWMRNTRIPLDIAFLDRNGAILNVERMEPQTDENTFSAAPAMYALELPAGWFEAHDVGAGDRMEF